MAKLLLIDDEQEILDIYKRALERDGHQTVSALNGAEAFARLGVEKFDLLILDLKMPKMTGAELITQLQKSPLNARCPILISSAFIDSQAVTEFARVGRIHFFPKPFRPALLTERVNAILRPSDANLPIDARFIRRFTDSTLYVFKTMLETDLQAGAPYLKTSEECSGDISAIVNVVSPVVKGTLSISFTAPHFLKMVSRLLKIEFKQIDKENKDAVAEILNIIFGHARTALNTEGLNIVTARPSIVTGDSHTLDHLSRDLPTTVIVFTGAEFSFRVEICAQS